MNMSMEASKITRRNEAIEDYLETMGERRSKLWSMESSEETGLVNAHPRKFHAYWDLLMPVVGKIMAETKDGFHILPSYSGGFISRFGTGQNRRGETPIEAAWMAVSNYILEKK